MKPFIGRATALGLGVSLAFGLGSADAADKPYDGITLNLASQNDQFAAVLAAIAPEFEAQTGAKVNVDILSYPELLTKITADYVGHTKGYDLATVDIVWSGQFAEAGYTVDLTDWIKRDAAEIKVDDIYPSLMSSLGGYKGKQVAFPFAGYANVLAYRKDLYEAAGLKAPATMEDFVADAIKLTDKSKKAYGFVANGQKGPAVAQDWMQYNRQFGGSILDKDGKPTLNSPANIASVVAYKKLFDDAAPPGAADYDWGGREESFRQGSGRQHADLVNRRRRLRQSESVEDRRQGRDQADPIRARTAAGLWHRRLGARHQQGHRTRSTRKPPGLSSNG